MRRWETDGPHPAALMLEQRVVRQRRLQTPRVASGDEELPSLAVSMQSPPGRSGRVEQGLIVRPRRGGLGESDVAAFDDDRVRSGQHREDLSAGQRRGPGPGSGPVQSGSQLSDGNRA